MRIGAMNFRGTYEDASLVLRTEDDQDYSRNTPLARNLGKQLNDRGIKFGKRSPVVIPLIGLELATADNGYGLTFNLREDAQSYIAPILAEDTGNFKTEDIDKETGLPTKVKDGGRTLYTRSNGLSRLFLDDVLNVLSFDRVLDSSNDVGRVVVVSAEGTSQDFDGKLAELQNQAAEAKQTYLAKLSQIRDAIDRKLKGSR